MKGYLYKKHRDTEDTEVHRGLEGEEWIEVYSMFKGYSPERA